MRVHVLGDGVLADTTRTCCLPHHELADEEVEVLWCCVDTPINDGRGEAKYVRFAIEAALDKYRPPLTLISSQVPVGFCAQMERCYPKYEFAVSPENIRVATGVQDFLNQTRIVVGARRRHQDLVDLLSPFCDKLLWMSPESAEMVKHALNGYLAMCIRFGNEIGALCETVGADADAVVEALRAERRVSNSAPLLPGDPPSQHLLRDVHTLAALGAGPLAKALLEGRR
jgi:UDPglucose 6-dehydrogenase